MFFYDTQESWNSLEKVCEISSDIKSVVYAIRNNVNNKFYIGKTNRKLRNRLLGHVYDANVKNSTYSFHRAIRKYGIKNFSVSILLITDDTDELSKSEILFIEKFQSFGKNGYNMTKGGDGLCGFHHSTKTKEKISKLKRNISMSEDQRQRMLHPVQQINPETLDIVCEYVSVTSALKTTNIHNIGKCCRSELKFAGGFIWRYVNEDDKIRGSWSEQKRNKMKERLSRKNSLCRKVYQLNKDGSVVNTFDSIKHAIKQTQICNISAVCRNVRKEAGGFLWKYVDSEPAVV